MSVDGASEIKEAPIKTSSGDKPLRPNFVNQPWKGESPSTYEPSKKLPDGGLATDAMVISTKGEMPKEIEKQLDPNAKATVEKIRKTDFEVSPNTESLMYPHVPAGTADADESASVNITPNTSGANVLKADATYSGIGDLDAHAKSNSDK